MADTDRPDFAPWFADRGGTILVYRVNRRPLAQGNLFAEQPEDVLDHLDESLLFGEPIETRGRGGTRVWRLGNRAIDPDQRLLSGQIGWERSDARPADHYDRQKKAWVDTIDEHEVTARSIFAFEGSTRELAVVKHPTFSEATIAHVFTDILQRGEQARSAQTTDWAVEPILDESDFRSWLQRTAVIQVVRLVAKLPNPDAADAFDPVISRLRKHRASALEELLKAQDPETGLQDLQGDPHIEAFIAMASEGFGYITSRGNNLDRGSSYDSRSRVLREHVEFPETWGGLLDLLLDFLRRRRD